jgi:hypothetical protein
MRSGTVPAVMAAVIFDANSASGIWVMLMVTSGLSSWNFSNIWGSSAPSAPCVQISRSPVAGLSSTVADSPAGAPPSSLRPQPVSSSAPDVTSAIPSIVARRREEM